MSIYEGSRYVDTPTYERDGKNVFEFRERYEFNLEDSIRHEIIDGDTLDGLAYRYYNDSQLRWVILEANKQFNSDLDIKNGDMLVIPSIGEVMNLNE